MGVLVFAAVLAFFALAEFGPGWVRRHRQHPSSGPNRSQETTRPPTPEPGETDSEAEREEMRLSGRLVAGDLPCRRYHERMAELAARDAGSHPVVVPPVADA